MDGIRLRLFVAIMIATLPGFLLIIIMLPKQQTLLEAKAKQKALLLLQQAKLRQDNVIDETQALLKRLSKQPQVVASDATTCSALMANVQQKSPRYTTLGLIDRDGLVTCSAVPLPGAVDVRDRRWFQQAIRTQDFAVGQYAIGKITNLPILSFGYPVMDSNGKTTAVVFASLDLSYINESYVNELAVTEQLPAGTTISLVDREGTILVRSPEGAKWLGKSIQDSALFQQFVSSSRKTITLESSDSDNVPHLFAVGQLLPQEVPDLTIIIGIPDARIQAQINRDLFLSLLLVVLVSGLALAIANWFSQRSIQRPILRLQTLTHQMATGNLQVRVSPPYGAGELQQLAMDFNQMATALERYVAEQATVQKARERAEIELRFVSVVSHELRSPLSALQMIGEMFETFGDQMSEERKQSYLRQLNLLIEQMNQLMNDVLLIRQAEAESFEIKWSRFNLEDFCHNLIRELQVGVNQERAIALSWQGDCSAVFLDENLLRSILINLLINAIKYSPPESTVYVDLNCIEQTIVMQVRDEGIGIPADDLPRLFDMFYRAGNVGDISGTGLGLAIVKRFVELLNGEITVASEVGAGTTVRVSIQQSEG